MAVPGCVLHGRNRGGHALIRDGAKIVETADDIVGELRRPGGAPQAPLDGSSVEVSSSSSRALLDALLPGEAYDVEAMVTASGLDGTTVLRALTDLELAGLVRRSAGGVCIRVR
jgi:DNA processing protein